MNCPSCGGALDWDERFAHLVVCPFCSSSIVVDEKALRIAGRMNVLAVPQGPLFVGGHGRVGKKRFKVSGRIRYGYGKGMWDEWYLILEDGSTAWISQDEGEYTFERLRDSTSPPPRIAEASPGDLVVIDNLSYHVDERDRTTCEGGEGQLPFAVEVGHELEYLDLSAGKKFASVEIEDDGVRIFHGRHLPRKRIVMDFDAQEAGATPAPSAAAAATAGRRQRVVRDPRRAVNLKCYSCGHPLPEVESGTDAVTCRACGAVADLSGDHITCTHCSETIPVFGGDEAGSTVCRFCKARLSLEGDVPKLLEVLKDRKRKGPRCAFELGAKCLLRGTDRQVVGHIRFVEKEEGRRYWSDEFLLHSKEHGYVWLVTENGHFSLAEEVRGVQARRSSLQQKTTFRAQGRQWTVFERGEAEIAWVDGELPWVAQVGDRNMYADCIAPPYMLSGEFTGTEAEWFLAEYLPRSEVAEAFGVPPAGLPPTEGVAPHQPYARSTLRRAAIRVTAVFAALLLLLVLLDGCTTGSTVKTYNIAEPGRADGLLTEPFEITKADTICSAEFKAPVNNEWVSLSGAVVDAQDKVLLEFGASMSYYHGVEGGESWSEGSRSDTVYFLLREPGRYRFLLDGEAGSGNSPDSRVGKSVVIQVREGAVLARYYVILTSLALVWLLFEGIHCGMFESRRWAPVLEDD